YLVDGGDSLDAGKTNEKKRAAMVKERYQKYYDDVQAFKRARAQVMASKTNLQNVLDAELYERRKITQPKYWDFELDEIGNVHYEDSEKDYMKKFEKWARTINKQKPAPEFDDDDLKWDWVDKAETVSAPGEKKGLGHAKNPSGGSAGTSG